MIPPAVQQAMFLTALSYFRSEGADADPRSIYDRVLARHDPNGLYNRSSVRSVVDQAGKAHRAAGELDQPDRSLPFRAGDHPIDPSCQAANRGYCYRVVIVASDGAGNQVETAVTIMSDTTMSADQIRQSASELWADQNRQVESPKGRDAKSTHATVVRVIIISIGRAR